MVHLQCVMISASLKGFGVWIFCWIYININNSFFFWVFVKLVVLLPRIMDAQVKCLKKKKCRIVYSVVILILKVKAEEMWQITCYRSWRFVNVITSEFFQREKNVEELSRNLTTERHDWDFRILMHWNLKIFKRKAFFV